MTSTDNRHTNPLLSTHSLPPFDHIQPEHIEPAIRALLDQSRERLNARLEQDTQPSWENLPALIEQWDDELGQAWSPVKHLNSVMNNPELRDAYNACLPLLSQYNTELGQNQALFNAYQTLRDSDSFAQLTTAQQASIEHALRDFRLNGVALEDDKKQRFAELKQRLSALQSTFSENVLDATQAWRKTLSDRAVLDGLPDSALALFEQQAKQENLQDTYLITLEAPSFLPIMQHANNRELRREIYTAFVTRASGEFPTAEAAKTYDNSQVMHDILMARSELAELLGFDSYAEYSIATKMADNSEAVLSFLLDLSKRCKPQAEREFAELAAFAQEHDQLAALEPWDVSFYAERLRQARYDFSQEDVKPYFPIDRVLSGMFEVVSRLFGITIDEHDVPNSYHNDVRFFHVYKDGELIAKFYLDLYARSHKRGGAWMDECRVRRRTEHGLQLPVAYLVCNFTPAVGDQPALLTHDEVTTLFHEFGHGLHHMLTRIDTAAVSGINGVAWDAVELPSQFMENWCYEPEALAFISGHVDSGEPLPKALLDKLLAAKHFQSAMMMMRQLEFALFDLRLHHEFSHHQALDIQALLDDVRTHTSVVPIAAFNRFQHSFSHIFAGGYAAGYYSYKWAEVLSADAFAQFEQEGIFNADTGARFLDCILSQGGSQPAEQLFKRFKGRAPNVDALLRHSGINDN